MAQPDIILQEEQPVRTQPIYQQPSQPQIPPQATPSIPFPENKTFSIFTFVLSLVSIPLVGIAYFAKIDILLLFGIIISIISIILSIIAESQKKPGEKFAFSALVVSSLTLLSAILIFIRTIVALPV